MVGYCDSGALSSEKRKGREEVALFEWEIRFEKTLRIAFDRFAWSRDFLLCQVS